MYGLPRNDYIYNNGIRIQHKAKISQFHVIILSAS